MKEKVVDVDGNKSADMVFKVIRYVIIGFFLLITVCNSFYSVKETETAVITTFGKASIVEGKGLKFKIPYIQKVIKVDTTVKGFSIGYFENEDGSTSDVNEESVMITSDYNFVDIDFYISYEIKDPIKFLYDSDQPELILKNIAMGSIRSVMSAYKVDTALTTGKAEIQSNIKQMIIARLEEADIGINLVDASIQDVEPPTDDIKSAFKAVETAKQQKESAINYVSQIAFSGGPNIVMNSCRQQRHRQIRFCRKQKLQRLQELMRLPDRLPDSMRSMKSIRSIL